MSLRPSIRADALDAVIGNPPYVRQEDIPKKKKEAYRSLVKREVQLQATGRSDLHIFFWGHAVSFLKPDGWLGFLTSSQWLDVEYGFPLQHFLLERFRISAIIESRIEPWFVGARVQTAVTVAQLDQDETRRTENIVRFVEVRRPLADVLASDGTSAGAIAAADDFRDLIMSTTTDVTSDQYRIRCVRQGDLLQEGVRIGEILRGQRVYAGAKWGIPLRAPDLWKDLEALAGSRMRPLGELAEVRFGIKTGADKFFYVDDLTNEALGTVADSIEFEERYQAPHRLVSDGTIKIVKNGYGEHHPIEARYLEPVIHSLMHIDRYEVTGDHCQHLVLMLGESTDELEGTFVAGYTRRGEELGVHKGSTVAARASESRPWYDLTNARRVGLLWAKSHQYRHCAPVNPARFAANCNLYTVDAAENSMLAAAILNSSIVLLAKHLYGRPVGVESNLKTEVVDVNMMPVPDWTQADARLRQRLVRAIDQLRSRQVLGVLSQRRLRRSALLQKGQIDKLDELDDQTEFDQADRQELDDAVLTLLGVRGGSRRRELRDQLYGYLEEYFENARRKEEHAIVNKATAKQRSKLTPQALALDVFSEVEKQYPTLLNGYRELAGEDGDIAVEGIRVPGHGKAELIDDLLMTGVRFAKGRGKGEIVKTRSADQARLVLKIVELGEVGRSHFIPINQQVILAQIRRVGAHLKRRSTRVQELIEARTSDPEISRKAFDLVMARF